MAARFLWFSLIIFLVQFTTIVHSEEYSTNDVCQYTINIRTGTIANAGTDANVGISLYNEKNTVFEIKDIIKWGDKMGPGHDHFENGNLDLFGGSGPCLDGGADVCAMKLISDNSGHKPGWFVDSVEVIACYHGRCVNQLFDVHQWLATDEYPYQLFAYRSNCGFGVKIQ